MPLEGKWWERISGIVILVSFQVAEIDIIAKT
jgi:hypothetical protein